jgi:hypothetical protein
MHLDTIFIHLKYYITFTSHTAYLHLVFCLHLQSPSVLASNTIHFLVDIFTWNTMYFHLKYYLHEPFYKSLTSHLACTHHFAAPTLTFGGLNCFTCCRWQWGPSYTCLFCRVYCYEGHVHTGVFIKFSLFSGPTPKFLLVLHAHIPWLLRRSSAHEDVALIWCISRPRSDWIGIVSFSTRAHITTPTNTVRTRWAITLIIFSFSCKHTHTLHTNSSMTTPPRPAGPSMPAAVVSLWVRARECCCSRLSRWDDIQPLSVPVCTCIHIRCTLLFPYGWWRCGVLLLENIKIC